MASNWTPESWTAKEARHLPSYQDAGELARVEETLAKFPPLVFAGEARALKTDLAEACLAVLKGDTRRLRLDFDPRAAVGVVLAAGGYPGDYAKGLPITGLDQQLPDTKVFHAGTVLKDGEYQTSGGRVLCVVGLGKSVRGAQERAYARVRQIAFDGMQYRQDIGYRAVARETTAGT